MVLELKVPHGNTLADLRPLLPVFLSYVLSFIFVGIYWNNHHHMLQAVEHVAGGNLWANLHLLFWLSLVPFVTGWMGENNFAAAPVAIYGVVLLCAALAYKILQSSLIRTGGHDSALARAMGRDWKGRVSPVIYLVSIGLALWQPRVACAGYVSVAILWLIPDRRIERNLPAR
jgi:uncharacterized membrane protein